MLTAFPAGAHDDWVDAVAQALNYLRESSEPGMITGVPPEKSRELP